MEIYQLSAVEISDKVRSGKLTALEVTEHFLERIERYNGELGAFLLVLRERALEKAAQIDNKREKGEALGKLAGVPIGIKDNLHIEGQITSCASKFMTNYRAPFWSSAVKALEEEDAILIGKTNLDEFAMGSSTIHSALMETNNPWNTKCSAGGSSGGSAVAVAARLCSISLGSDTGGSIRQPASLCGIVGMKPTYGRVSRFGLVAFGSSLDQIGPFATSVEDAALCMEVMGKHCRWDSTSINRPAEAYLPTLNGSLEGVKLGVPSQFLADLSGDTKRVFDSAVEKAQALGAEIIDIDLSLLKYSIAVYYILATAEAATNLARFDGVKYGVRSENAEDLDGVYDKSRHEGFGKEVQRRILLGTFVLSSGYQNAYYKKAQKVRTKIIEQFREAFNRCDAVMMPSAPTAAFEKGAHKDPLQEYLEDIYTICANLAGLPGVSIPAGFTGDKRPIGVQLLCNQQQDVQVCALSHALEKALACSAQIPELVSK